MKILTIAATPFFSDRGCHVRILNGAKYLKKFGAEVKICTYFDGEDVEGFDIEKIGKVGWYKKTAPGFSWGKFWLDVKLIFLCRRTIRKFRPDVIHAHLYEGLGVGYIAKILAFQNVPIVIDLQADLDEEFENYSGNHYIARRIFVWLSRRLINRCDWLVLSSENLIPLMENLFGHKDRIAVVRDGIDLDLFKNIGRLTGAEREKIKEIKKWKGDKKLLVYVGGLSDNKGVGDLLKAFLDLTLSFPPASPELQRGERKRESSNWKLLIGGFGSDEEKYKKFIDENTLADSVYSIGKVNYFSLPAYLALADAAIDPKNGSTESSGKLVNLMAAGLPIICFDNDFNRARLGEEGLYIKNMNELGEKLNNFQGIGKINYSIEDLSEGKEAQKLFGIFQSLTK